MATMEIFSKDYNVVYVDTKNGSPGDGTTPNVALDALPTPSTMVDESVYLCRRYDDDAGVYEFSASNQNTTTMEAIYVVGMPISGDSLYATTPTEAISAWGADTDDYFRVYGTNYNYYWRFTNIKNFGMHRVQFERKQNSEPSSTVMVQAHGTDDNDGLGFVTNCKFINRESAGVNLIDLSDPGYTTNTDYSPGKVSFYGFNYFAFKDNEVYYTSDYNGGNSAYQQFNFQYMNSLDIEGNVTYVSSQGNTSYTYYNYINFIENLNINNNTFDYISQDYANAYYGYAYYITNSAFTDIRNITVSDSRYYKVDPTTHTESRIASVIYCDSNSVSDNGTVLRVKDVNINLNYIQKFGNNVLHLLDYESTEGRLDYALDSVESRFEDLTLSLPVSGGIGTPDYASYGAYISSPRGKINNITCHVPQGNSMYLRYSRLAKGLDLEGYCNFLNCGFVEVDSLRFRGTERRVVRNESSMVYLKSVYMDQSSGWTEAWLDEQGIQSQQIQGKTIVNSCNLPLSIDWEEIPAEFGGVWANNVNGQAGNWVGDNYHYFGQTWNATRVGGGSASIKLTKGSNPAESPYGLWIAPPTFRGLEWTPGSTGQKTLKVYVAFKNLDADDLAQKFHVRLEVPRTNSKQTYQSSFQGVWEDDASTWLNDSGLTQKVLVMPFDVTLLEAVTVRMKFQWYDPAGYLYVDPQVVFE